LGYGIKWAGRCISDFDPIKHGRIPTSLADVS
jgi:hypothetical protein